MSGDDSSRSFTIDGTERYYIDVQDVDGRTVRIPSRSIPEITHRSFEPVEVSNLLISIEGVVAVASDGTEQAVPMRASSWLRSVDQHEADHFMRFKEDRRA